MAFLGVTYVYDRDENFKEFVGSVPIPADKAERWLNSKPTFKLEKDGDTYILTSTNNGDMGNAKVVKLKNGVEFKENLDDGHSCMTTFTVDGNKITHIQKFENEFWLTYKSEYKGKELIVTMTNSKWDGSAKRFFVAA